MPETAGKPGFGMALSRRFRNRLADIGRLPDEGIDLAETALILATAERPGVPLTGYRRHLGRIATAVGAYAGDDAGDLDRRIEALVQVIARRYGYTGAEDAFDDPGGANLTRVIDGRCGLPVAIGIVYMQAARAQGWAACGIDFPARFFIRLEAESRRAILDPFDGGRIMSAPAMRAFFKAVAGNEAELTPAHYQAMGNRDVLLRLQNNIRIRHIKAERFAEALETVETMLLLAPDNGPLWRDAGMLNLHLDNIRAAVAALEAYLRRSGDDPARYRTSVLLQELRGKLN
jgi:regulator of sirC expression with transglutaminase-like and TPR domain